VVDVRSLRRSLLELHRGVGLAHRDVVEALEERSVEASERTGRGPGRHTHKRSGTRGNSMAAVEDRGNALG